MKLTLLVFLAIINECQGHGYMYEPPSRMSAWKHPEFDFHTNYQHHEMNCGGREVQWTQNGGKCGICGDSWSGPRNYERPSGAYVQHNVIPRTYREREIISIQLEITASHMGWNEFRICDIAKSGGIEANHECLNQNVLADITGQTRFYFETSRTGTYRYELVLPAGLTCSHCVLQWKWKCGNNYGDNQEEFYACADVSVLPGDSGTTIVNNATLSSATLPANIDGSDSTETSTSTSEIPTSTLKTTTSTRETSRSATEAPTSTTEAPTSTTEAPTSTTEAPTSTTEAPTSTTEAPKLITEAKETVRLSSPPDYSILSTVRPNYPASSTPSRPYIYTINPPNFIPFIPPKQGSTVSVLDIFRNIGIIKKK